MDKALAILTAVAISGVIGVLIGGFIARYKPQAMVLPPPLPEDDRLIDSAAIARTQPEHVSPCTNWANCACCVTFANAIRLKQAGYAQRSAPEVRYTPRGRSLSAEQLARMTSADICAFFGRKHLVEPAPTHAPAGRPDLTVSLRTPEVLRDFYRDDGLSGTSLNLLEERERYAARENTEIDEASFASAM